MLKYLPAERFKWKKLIQYLLQGLLIIAPVAVTIYSIYWIVSTVDPWLPIFREPVRDIAGNIIRYKVKNYGLGFLIIVVTIIIIGYLSSVFIRSRIFHLFDSWLEKTPGVKYIYSSVRDFFVQRITFRGWTGDPQKLIQLLTSQYQFKSQPTPLAGFFLGETRRKSYGGIMLKTPSIIDANNPFQQYGIVMELNRPDGPFELSEDYRRLIAGSHPQLGERH